MIAAILRTVWIGSAAAAVLAATELSDKEKEQFLEAAKVVSIKELSVGVTLSERLTLTDGSLTHDSHFQDVDEYKAVFQGQRGYETNFRDSYRYNVVAYRLDRMLDLRMTPVSIERKHRGKKGALTWWVDDVLMMELERWKKSLHPPDKDAWNDQMYQARVFNELVFNTDPNLGNVLIDKNWKIWLIDFTRAFRLQRTLKNEENVVRIDRRVWDNLRKLDDATLRAAMGPMLLNGEREALLARRDQIVSVIERRIAEKGEAAVICDRPGH